MVDNTNDETQKKSQRRWKDWEVESLLAYMKNTIQSGHLIEKPTANQYYASALEVIKIVSTVTVTQVKGKIRHLKTGYVNTIKWRKETGQGVLESSGQDSFKAATMERCQFFDDLDEIYGSKISTIPPAILQTSTPDVIEVVIDEEDNAASSHDDEEDTSPTDVNAKKSIKVATKKLKTEKCEGGISAFIECRRQKTEMDNKKIGVEEKKLEFEIQKWNDEVKLKEREMLIKEQELALQKQKMEMESEIHKLELQLKYK